MGIGITGSTGYDTCTGRTCTCYLWVYPRHNTVMMYRNLAYIWLIHRLTQGTAEKNPDCWMRFIQVNLKGCMCPVTTAFTPTMPTRFGMKWDVICGLQCPTHGACIGSVTTHPSPWTSKFRRRVVVLGLDPDVVQQYSNGESVHKVENRDRTMGELASNSYIPGMPVERPEQHLHLITQSIHRGTSIACIVPSIKYRCTGGLVLGLELFGRQARQVRLQ